MRFGVFFRENPRKRQDTEVLILYATGDDKQHEDKFCT